jgi:hypothetical protein
MSTTLRETHIAIVTDNDDDEQRGRIKVASSTLLGVDENGDPIEYPAFIEPLYPYLSSSDGERTDGGWFFIPSVGTYVQVEVAARSGRDEVPGGIMAEGHDIKWVACVWPRADSDGVPDDFLTNYPQRKGIRTELGHQLLFDDTEGSELVRLECSNANGTSFLSFDDKGTATLLTSGGNALVMDDDASSITLLSKDSMMLSLNSSGLYLATANSNMIVIDDGNDAIAIQGQTSITLQSTTVLVNGGGIVSTDGTGLTASGCLFEATLGAGAPVGGFSAGLAASLTEIAAGLAAFGIPTVNTGTLIGLLSAGSFTSSNWSVE